MPRYSFLLNIAGLGLLLLLGACSNSQQPTSSSTASPTASTPVNATAKTGGKLTAVSDVPNKSVTGLVVESGAYHLELVPSKEETEIHLDLFLKKGDNHDVISSAKVLAQVQLPNGTQKTIDLPYDASGKHYAGQISDATAGEYKVTIQSDIAGEKVNARYVFKR